MGLLYKLFDFLPCFLSEFWKFFIHRFYIRVFLLESKLQGFFSYYRNLFILNVIRKARHKNKRFLVFFHPLPKKVRGFFINSLIGFSFMVGKWEVFSLTPIPLYQLITRPSLSLRKKTIIMIWPHDLAPTLDISF